MQSTSLNPVLPITDTQLIELLGRNRLIDDLLRAGLEVALPARDRGIDLIAYADLRTSVDAFVARPIQMKAASSRSFSVDVKWGRFANPSKRLSKLLEPHRMDANAWWVKVTGCARQMRPPSPS
ncbi:MAG: hypothetical protein WD847_16265 [Pirellulales bacterium]